jgi:hypothetical protein
MNCEVGPRSGLLSRHTAMSPRANTEMASGSKIMSNKMLSSRNNEMKVLFSKIDEVRELAKRSERLRDAAKNRGAKA